MTKSSRKFPEKLPPPNLLLPREEALKKIQAQIDKGASLGGRLLRSESDVEQARSERSSWSHYNTELLTRLFDNSSMADEYNRFLMSVFQLNPSLSDKIEEFSKDMNESIGRLEAIRDRLDLIPEILNSNSSTGYDIDSQTLRQDIFIVHGHDEAARQAVSRFIEKLGLRAIILHEQPNAGRTIIEKFEAHSSVGYAVVLITPDDIGAPGDKPTDIHKRVRQNVVFELGYFIGKLGRQNVCALYVEGVELPSDLDGIVYIPIDNSGAWRLSLAKEMKHSGIVVDLNKIL